MTYTAEELAQQAARRQQAGLLDKAQSSKQVTRFECIHCRAIYSPIDEQCPRCGAFEAARCKTPNVI